MKKYKLAPVTKENWEEAIMLTEKDNEHVSVCEALACAYIKPWDEAFDPYVFLVDEVIVGFIYVSYTPKSVDNYWIGGLFIKEEERNKGYGKRALFLMIDLIQFRNPKCKKVKLMVNRDNLIAKEIYEKVGFTTNNETNKYGEIKYELELE